MRAEQRVDIGGVDVHVALAQTHATGHAIQPAGVLKQVVELPIDDGAGSLPATAVGQIREPFRGAEFDVGGGDGHVSTPESRQTAPA